MSTLIDLSGKTALITGASRGIGTGILQSLARCGATCVGTATTAEGAARISALLQEMGAQGQGLVVDVAEPASIQALVAALAEKGLVPGVLVNNAGITRDNLLLRMKDEEWEAVMRTNLDPVYRLSKQFLRGMVKARFGRIVNITSVVGSTGNGGQANYAAAKAGVVAFTKSLAREVGSRGITVNCVAPGYIDTDMTRALTEEQRQAILANIPTARMGTPADIGAAVAFLASDLAAYITGETLHVNGGLYMV
jgi:3-oxoacyl-[acyl-carrier protein] reductase